MTSGCTGPLFKSPTNFAFSASADGKLLLFGNQQNLAFLVSLEPNAHVVAVKSAPSGYYFSSVAISPNGQKCALSISSDNRLGVLVCDSGLREIYELPKPKHYAANYFLSDSEVTGVEGTAYVLIGGLWGKYRLDGKRRVVFDVEKRRSRPLTIRDEDLRSLYTLNMNGHKYVIDRFDSRSSFKLGVFEETKSGRRRVSNTPGVIYYKFFAVPAENQILVQRDTPIEKNPSIFILDVSTGNETLVLSPEDLRRLEDDAKRIAAGGIAPASTK